MHDKYHAHHDAAERSMQQQVKSYARHVAQRFTLFLIHTKGSLACDQLVAVHSNCASTGQYTRRSLGFLAG